MAKKSLGQNFLTNKNKIGEIISALELKNRDIIIEIGPGHGELTREILKNPFSRLMAIEKDAHLANLLKNDKFLMSNVKIPKIEIITGDVLKILPPLVENLSFGIGNLKLVGNIPYYITGFLLRTLSELKYKPKIIVLTVQKEVAERICAQPPTMNLLAASVQLWAQPEIMGLIPKEDFSPEPKVDSAIIKLITKDLEFKTKNTENFYKFIKILFKQPRKTISNNVSELFKNKKEADVFLEKNGIAPASRPQDLNVESIKEMAEIIYNKQR